VAFGHTAALTDVSLDVRAGEVLALLGPSGSGKSTLLRVIAGITPPGRGRVYLAGHEVAGPAVFVEPERRRVGLVFQDYALFPHLTVAANIAFGLRGRGRAEVDAAVHAMLQRVRLDGYADRYPHMLSGGERQRVALARALAPNPHVLLMDEPFSSLDSHLRDRVRQQTIALLRETATTTVIVTHDPAEAVRVSDRVALLRGGRLLQCGPAEELYTRPTTAFAARFLGEVNELAGVCRAGQVDSPLGTFAAPRHLQHVASVRVCIRPQHLRLSRQPTPIHGRVRLAEFVGDGEHVTVDVPGLFSPLSLRVFGRAGVRSGDAVYLEIDSSNVLIVPADER
jgi:iron(III) transport system ATP-binding protein